MRSRVIALVLFLIALLTPVTSVAQDGTVVVPDSASMIASYQDTLRTYRDLFDLPPPDSGLQIVIGGSFSFLDGLSETDLYTGMEIDMNGLFEKHDHEVVAFFQPENFQLELTQSKQTGSEQHVTNASLAVYQTVPKDQIPAALDPSQVIENQASAYVKVEEITKSVRANVRTESLSLGGAFLWNLGNNGRIQLAQYNEIRRVNRSFINPGQTTSELNDELTARLPDLEQTPYYSSDFASATDSVFSQTSVIRTSPKINYDSYVGVQFSHEISNVRIRLRALLGTEDLSVFPKKTKSLVSLTLYTKSPNLVLGAQLRRSPLEVDEMGLFLASRFSIEKLAKFILQ